MRCTSISTLVCAPDARSCPDALLLSSDIATELNLSTANPHFLKNSSLPGVTQVPISVTLFLNSFVHALVTSLQNKIHR